ncbi:MAG TPA: hypothetical protein VFM82_02750 [Flavobacteriaceae bacterium]|nr:hypothetical protein [Flavobacteriaceae bacterium]
MRTKEYFLNERVNEMIREMEVREAEYFDHQKQEYFNHKNQKK